jgi:predicted HAD superfamily Cof-like phosphohydrolase
MNEQQLHVQSFHAEMDLALGDYRNPKITDGKLRIELITEELGELIDAIEADDLAEAIDALCDLLYVVNGAAVTWGIDLEPFFNEVHRSNMRRW